MILRAILKRKYQQPPTKEKEEESWRSKRNHITSILTETESNFSLIDILPPPSPPTLLPSPTKNKMQSRNKSDTNKRKQSININDNFNRFGSRVQYNKNPNPNHHKKKEEIRISSTIQQLNRREILMKLSSDRQFQLRQMTPAAN